MKKAGRWRVKVALLAASGFDAARLEEYLQQQTVVPVQAVWTVTEPGSVLAALDHDPDVFLLDMRWREAALAAARTLQQLGVPLIICLFDQLDDPLIGEALAMALPIFHWGAPWRHLASRMGAAG